MPAATSASRRARSTTASRARPTRWASVRRAPLSRIRGYAGDKVPHRVPLVLNVNAEEHELFVPVYKTLLEVLREDLDLTGTKHGCELGECGTCTVLVDGRSILSCLMLGLDAEGREVTTIEGMAEDGRLHPLQDTFADLGAAQCGYCT